MKRYLARLLPVLVIVAAAAVAVLFVLTKPQPAIEAPKEVGEVVEVRAVTRRVEPLIVAAQGRVIPGREVIVQPQIAGRIETVAPELVPGGIVSRGATLFTIEPVDYRLAVAQARTRLAEAEAALALERGRQAVARREYELFEDELPAEQDPALALREPQLRAAEAAVAAARAQLRQAEVNLERTAVTAPFNAIVRSESVDPGQLVSPQTAAARLVGTDFFWVQASVPVADLPYLDTVDGDTPGSKVLIRYDAGSTTLQREGEVERLLSDLDPAGQMARVLVRVDDPLGLADGGPRLLLESFVDVEIRANRDVEVVTLPREHLHNGEEVYVYDDGKLEIRRVDVVWRRPDTVLIGEGLAAGDQVVTSTLSTPVPGMKLRLDERAGVAETQRERP